MKINRQQYAKDLVDTHGKAKAIDMMQAGLLNSEHYGSSLTFSDEIDFAVTDNGRMEQAKIQSKKTEKRKITRIRSTISFYKHILGLLGAGVK